MKSTILAATALLVTFGIMSNSAFAQSSEALTLRIVGSGTYKGGNFIAIVQKEDQSLSPVVLLCGAGTHYPFSENEKVLVFSSAYKRPLSSSDMTQRDCQIKIESLRKATLQNPVFMVVNSEKD